MSFQLSKCKTIGLYGYTKRAKKIKLFLEKKGFEDVFFIDRNIFEYSVDNIYTLDQVLQDNCDNLSDVVIIITLQNAVAHQTLAEEMCRAGIKKIIFLPIGARTRVKEALHMRNAYNELINNYIDTDAVFPDIEEIILKHEILNHNGIIYQDDIFTTFWMHINNIFVNNATDNFIEINKEYYGKPLATVDYYQALFNYFEKGQYCESLQKYMTAQGYITPEGKYDKDKLAGRYQLWCAYKAELNRGIEFFCASAPEVTINENGGFNIKDGLHRTIFLYMQKFAYVPVKLNTDTFKAFYDEGLLKELTIFLENNNIGELCTPIEHPAFYNFPTKMEQTEPYVIKAIQQYIGTADIENWDVLEISDYNSYFARIMSKMWTRKGKGYICSIETEYVNYAIAKHINQILQIKNVNLCFVEDVSILEKRKYRIVFALGKWSGNNYSVSMVHWFDEITNNILFWECDSSIAKEEISNILETTAFQEAELIGQYFNGEQNKQIFAIIKYITNN